MSQSRLAPLAVLSHHAGRLLQRLSARHEARIDAHLLQQRAALEEAQEREFRCTFRPRTHEDLMRVTREAALRSAQFVPDTLDRHARTRVFQTPIRAQHVLLHAHDVDAVVRDVNEHLRSTHGLFDICELIVQAAQRQRAARMTTHFVLTPPEDAREGR